VILTLLIYQYPACHGVHSGSGTKYIFSLPSGVPFNDYAMPSVVPISQASGNQSRCKSVISAFLLAAAWGTVHTIHGMKRGRATLGCLAKYHLRRVGYMRTDSKSNRRAGCIFQYIKCSWLAKPHAAVHLLAGVVGSIRSLDICFQARPARQARESRPYGIEPAEDDGKDAL
jgi:hypothetical protein